MRSNLIVLTTSAFLAASAQAQVRIDADDLAKDCRHKWPHYLYMNCAGYLSGILESLRAGIVVNQDKNGHALAAESGDAIGPLCIAGFIVPDELARAFVRYIEEHPDRLKEPPLLVAADALLDLDRTPPKEHVPPIAWEICGRKTNN